MNSNRKIKYFPILSLILIFYGKFVFANFEITEIMYDVSGTDTNREWVEVKNTSETPDDLSKWFLFSDNTRHVLSPQGDASVPPGGYAVIAQNASKFKIDWPSYTGLLFDSSWTGFNNSGETIALKDADFNLASPVTFTSSMGANGDGNSLQKIGGIFQAASPTPGVVGIEVSTSASMQSASQTSSAGVSAQSIVVNTGGSGGVEVVSKKKEIEIPRITTNILVKNVVPAGLALAVSAETFGYSKESLRFGRFIWNFGDGSTREDSEYKPFDYIYEYPGEYLMTLSYYRNPYLLTPDATDRVMIKVLSTQISISSIGSLSDPFIELENKSGMDIDISKWTIKGASGKEFTIPFGTILLQNHKLRFSPRITTMIFDDLHSLILFNPSGEVVNAYPDLKIKDNNATTTIIKSDNKFNLIENKVIRNTKSEPSIIDLNNLTANASLASGVSNQNIHNNYYVYSGLAGLILVGSFTMMYLRSKSNDDNSLDLEETLNADDIKIIE